MVGVAGPSDGALVSTACHEAARLGAEAAILVHVLEGAAPLDELHGDMGTARAMLRELFERTKVRDLRPVFDVRVAREATQELATAADDHAAHRIFVGESARDPEAVGPRTDMWLARFAPCTVTVVRPRRTRETPRQLLDPAPTPRAPAGDTSSRDTHTLEPSPDLRRKAPGPGSLRWRP